MGAVLAAFASIAAACSGSPAASPATAPSSAASSVSSTPPAAPAPTSSDPALPVPAAEERGGEEFGLTEPAVTRRVDAVEAAIAACMTDAGFEYYAVDYATVRVAMDSNSKPSGLTGDEFRDQFGYGITTLAAGPADQATLGLGERNIAIRDGLRAADRVAWERTLFGENVEQTFAVGLDNEDLSTTGGCTRAAVQQSFAPEELGPGFVNYQNDQGARVDADQRIIDAYVEWATCMRTDGYAYNHPDEIDADLATRLDAITGGGDPSALSPSKKDELTQVQGEELAIAAADQACDLQHVDAVRTQVEAELFGPDATQQ